MFLGFYGTNTTNSINSIGSITVNSSCQANMFAPTPAAQNN